MAKHRDRLGALAAGGEHLRFDFYGCSERVWKMRFGIERPFQELLASLGFYLLRVTFSAVRLVAV